MNDYDLLDEARRIVDNDRKADYGDVTQSFVRIASLWSDYLGINISAVDVAHMMMLLKISRGRNTVKRDSLVDIVGYALCADKLMGN